MCSKNYWLVFTLHLQQMQALLVEYYVQPEKIPTEILQGDDGEERYLKIDTGKHIYRMCMHEQTAFLTMSVSYYTNKLFAQIIFHAVLKVTHVGVRQFYHCANLYE